MPDTNPKPKTPSDLKPQSSTGGVLVLQWLTYAFWGWLIVGLIWVLSVILVNAIIGESVSEIVPYAMAASIVLLPIAFVTDLFYRKHEPLRKSGAAMVIMIIHAVIFALLGIGALITSVFTGLNALINTDSPSDVTTVVVIVAASATLLYAAAFLRTLNPFKKKTVSRIYAFSMLGLTLLLLVLVIVGPVVATLATREDRKKEAALSDITYSIQSYASQQNKLPSELSVLTFNSESTNETVKAGHVEYTAVGINPTDEKSDAYTSYRYQLCVVYDKEAKNPDYTYYQWDSSEYKANFSATPHDAGRVCYKLRT